MCLGIPGKIISIEDNPLGVRMGKVSFGGIVKEVCLAYTPEAEVGDYVVVHVGFAISCLDEEEARETLEMLAELEELAEEQGEPLTITIG
ncbi:TPA: HypC/HybG/HupF family hydrogenase formation chaperone [Candidatus Bipolaricaulota bacterium]|nr:HypC/HybG/HupF family hydrogenase formation chaperone [Candidatus Bipolaricaulota bacterium]